MGRLSSARCRGCNEREAEVRQMCIVIIVNEDIAVVDITMNKVLTVQVLKGKRDLKELGEWKQSSPKTLSSNHQQHTGLSAFSVEVKYLFVSLSPHWSLIYLVMVPRDIHFDTNPYARTSGSVSGIGGTSAMPMTLRM